MNKILLIVCFLSICFCAMPVRVLAQESSSSDTEQTVSTDDDNAKEEKKAKKKKDAIKLDEAFFVRFAINVATVLLIIFLIYYPSNHRSSKVFMQVESVFTFIMFNVIVFMLTAVLNQIKVSMGAAFGLFAVFSMLRYRTESISMKDMTYLLIFIALGLIGAMQLEFHEQLIINGFLVAFVFLLDCKWIFRREHSQLIDYELITNIKPENKELLITDLRQRTGLNVHRFDIKRIDFLKDSADIVVYYFE